MDFGFLHFRHIFSEEKKVDQYSHIGCKVYTFTTFFGFEIFDFCKKQVNFTASYRTRGNGINPS